MLKPETNAPTMSSVPESKYCSNLFSYERFRTREVRVGSIVIGVDHPISVQSMTTTDTMDTEKTVAQSARMIDAGCELVRFTAPCKIEMANRGYSKMRLNEMGYDVRL